VSHFETEVTATDLDRLRDAIAVSRRSRENGQHPFGAVLVDPSGAVVLESENSVPAENDCTAHAELKLARAAFTRFGAAALAEFTLYTSAEACAMCSGAIYWSGIGRVVHAMSEAQLGVLTGDHEENPTMALSSATVLNAGQRTVLVAGPALAEEAAAVHEGFWN
jgi:tRNA(Arg) A34 adenosine deaminase TadA